MNTIHKIQKPQPKIENQLYIYADLPIEEPHREEETEPPPEKDSFDLDDFYVSFMI